MTQTTREIFNATLGDGSAVNANVRLSPGRYCINVFGSTFVGVGSSLQATVQEDSEGSMPPVIDVAGLITTDGRYMFECGEGLLTVTANSDNPGSVACSVSLTKIL